MNRPQNVFRNESEASRILSMIERHAPRLMKTGGGSCGGESHKFKVEPHELEKMLAMHARGVPNVEIAAALRYSVSTISKYLRRHAPQKTT